MNDNNNVSESSYTEVSKKRTKQEIDKKINEIVEDEFGRWCDVETLQWTSGGQLKFCLQSFADWLQNTEPKK